MNDSATKSNSGLDLAFIDPEVSPSSDLFKYANGGWLNTAKIPDDKAGWGAFQELSEQSEKAVRQIIETLSPDDDPSSEQSKIANLFSSFMNESHIEQLGMAPITQLLKRVDQIDSVSALMRHLGWSARYGVEGLFSLSNDADPGDPTRYLIFVNQGGIGLPDEEYYRLAEHSQIRDEYLSHITKIFKLADIADPQAQAQLVFDLETKIASHHWDKVTTRDMVKSYFLQTWHEFIAAAPDLCWDEFLAGAELPEHAVSEIVNSQRTFIEDVASLVSEENLDSWRAWARWQILDSLADLGPAQLVEENFDFYGRKLRGIPQLRERWKRGVSLVEGALGEAVGKIYVQSHFPAEHKARALQLVNNLLEAYRRSISDLEWMTAETRAEALDKLTKFRVKIGYPDKWRDYSNLQINADDLIGNSLQISSFDFDHMITQLSGPVDRDEWFMYPQTVNAYFHPLRNEIVFPAAILQPPFFDANADDAVNYGGIGGVIGHEIGHGFDDQGSTCDGDGRLRNWWTDLDRQAFEQLTKSLVDQYDALSPNADPDVKVNGELTLGENIGDLGGLMIAYDAWKIAGGNEDVVDGFSGSQRFFISWAQCWRGIYRPEAIRQQLATDPHSPDELRCNQVVRNMASFHEAFNVTATDPMWLDPASRVKIW